MDDNIFVKWNDKWPEPSESVANIIFDTDIGPDYDDTGVAVMLHNYANKGKVNILAIVYQKNCCGTRFNKQGKHSAITKSDWKI